MHGSRFLRRVCVDGLKDKTEIISIFGESKHVILHIVGLYLYLPFSKHYVSILIQSQFLLFPSFYVKTTTKTNIVQHPIEKRDRLFEIFFYKPANISNGSQIILALFLPTETVEGLYVLLGNLFLAILVFHLHFIVGIEISTG